MIWRARRTGAAPEEDEGGTDPQLVAGLTAAGALVVGGFATVGVTGDLLPRMVRNQPVVTGGLVALVLVLVAVTLLVGFVKPLAAVLALALVVLVVMGVVSLQERENPQVAIAVDVDAAGKVSLKVTASASNLRSEERMLVQLVGLTEALEGGELRAACRSSVADRTGTDDERDVLLWNETGSASDGTASVVVEAFAASGNYVRFCALAILGERSVRNPGDDRFGWAYVDPAELPAAPATSAAPSA